MSRTLLITNDFPPRPGGIQSFVHNLAVRQPRRLGGGLRVELARRREVRRRAAVRGGPGTHPGAAAHPADRPPGGPAGPRVRLRHGLVRRGGPARAARRRACAAGPGVRRVVALTHGHEVGWAALPAARPALRRIGRGVDVTTYLGEYTRSRLARALDGVTDLRRLAPGVDVDTYHPAVDGEPVRARLGLADRPVVVCVSRLVPRKGQDMLIRALPEIRRRVPDAALLIVGGGPYRATLEKLARQAGVERDVVFTGSVPSAELPAHYAAGDVYAMPCRTRNRGLDVEGLGIVYLEASATGLPVVAGDSGGAPDAVREGETGLRGPRPGRRPARRPGGPAARRPGPGPPAGRGRPGLGGAGVALGDAGAADGGPARRLTRHRQVRARPGSGRSGARTPGR